jgi:formylglycine-generating enzyme required for sulfatase activity
MCTWSGSQRGREEFPVTCVPPDAARAFCRFAGGDLPLEVQWEYAATQAGDGAKRHFPWGDTSPPRCADVVYGRDAENGIEPCYANGAGWGPEAVTAADHPGGDVTLLGIADLGGDVDEIASESFVSLATNCWRAAPLLLPTCGERTGLVSARGASWSASLSDLPSALRFYGNEAGTPWRGFRCVRGAGG